MKKRISFKHFICIVSIILLVFSIVGCDRQNANKDISPTISFIVDGEKYATLSKEDTMPIPPVKEGYTFDGWYNDEKVDCLSDLEEDITLTAKWNLVNYTITYENTKEVSNSNVTSFTIESDVITLIPLSKDGYKFEGWYNGETKVTQIPSGTIGNITLSAKWLPLIGNITFLNTLGADNPNPEKFTFEDGVITLQPLFKDGYEFKGWHTKNIVVNSNGTTTTTVEAKWDKISYSITYLNTMGTSNTNPITYDIETYTIFLDNLEKTGYRFDGWFSGSNKITQISNGSIGNITLTAKWTKIDTNIWESANYTVYAMANGLNIRSEASTTGTKLGTANIGDSFTAYEKCDNWYKISYYGTTAYIPLKYVTAVANEAQFNNDAEPTVFTIAASQNGKKMNLRNDPAVVEDTLGMTFEVGKTPGTITKVGQNAAGNWFIVEYDEDGAGEKVPVKYYLKITSQTSEILGLTSGGANGYS